jgi:predicted ATPase
MPGPHDAISTEGSEGSESVRLFAERARFRDPAFVLGPANATTVAGVCRRLDGLPLAIELAAARVGALSVEQILERLEDSLELLTEGSWGQPPRQQTLRGALDWSHGFLSIPEQVGFRRLSVFAGGWTLAAAEALLPDEEVQGTYVLEVLSRLAEKSLAETVSEGDGVRHRMYEPVRQYAAEKLEKGGEAGETRRRHAEHFLALG